MSFVRAAIEQVVGLFVSDWFQSAVVVAIILLGWLAYAKFGAPALILLVLLLAGQMVWFARAEAKKSRRPSPS